MQAHQEPWQAIARAKVANTMSKIPREWVVDQADIEGAKRQRQLSGPFIERFLDEGELEIVRDDSVSLVDKVKSGQYTTLQAVRAYCKAAAIAHQIVSKDQ
jgi:amidase